MQYSRSCITLLFALTRTVLVTVILIAYNFLQNIVLRRIIPRENSPQEVIPQQTTQSKPCQRLQQLGEVFKRGG